MAATTETPVRSTPARRVRPLVDAALAAGIVAVLLFPIGAKLAADRLPTGPPPALAPLPADARPAALRDLPVGLQPGGELDAAAAALLGERNGARLLELVRSGDTGFPRGGVYSTLEPLLPETFTPAQAAAATDLGARLILLEADPAFAGSAAPAAFALLDRARQGGACEPALNLLLLVASDKYADDRIVAREGERAWRACPRRPDGGMAPGPVPVEQGGARHRPVRLRPRRSCAGARDLRAARARVPGLGGGVGGAGGRLRTGRGDVAAGGPVGRAPPLRAGARRLPARRTPEPRRRVDMGVARALSGLGRADEAAALQRRVVAALPSRRSRRPSSSSTSRMRTTSAKPPPPRSGCRRWPGTRRRAPGCSPNLPVDSGLSFRARGPPRADLARRRPVRAAVREATATRGLGRRVERRLDDLSFIPVYRATPRRHRQRPLVRRLGSPARPDARRAPGGRARRDPGEVHAAAGPSRSCAADLAALLRRRHRAARAGRAVPCRGARDRRGAVLRRRWYRA